VDCWDGSKDFEFTVSGASDAAFNVQILVKACREILPRSTAYL
jgi:hypothetical protein